MKFSFNFALLGTSCFLPHTPGSSVNSVNTLVRTKSCCSTISCPTPTTVLSNVIFVNILHQKKNSWSPTWPSSTQVSLGESPPSYALPDLCTHAQVVCAVYRGEAILLHYVSLYDQAQEEFTPPRAVPSPWGLWGVVCGPSRGACQKAAQTFLHPAADWGAQTTIWQQSRDATHHCELVIHLLLCITTLFWIYL